MTPAEAAKAVLMLQAAYPGARMTAMTGELYESMLADLEFDVVRGAIARLICTSKFLPTIAEVRDAAAEITLGPIRSAVAAWGDVTMAVRRVGHYGCPKFEDPLVAECVRALGWRSLCLGDSGEAADRARFCELYSDLQRKQRQRDVSEPGRLLPAGRPPNQLPSNVRELTRKVGNAG